MPDKIKAKRYDAADESIFQQCRRALDLVVRRYRSDDREEWNSFLALSAQPHFMFDRNYMEYHSDRFIDESLMFYQKGKLVGLFPANRRASALISHEGLTFGGLIMPLDCSVDLALALCGALETYCHTSGITSLTYKIFPYPFARQQCSLPQYWLLQSGGQYVRSDVGSVIDTNSPRGLSDAKKRTIRKAERAGLAFRCSSEYELAWPVLESVLSSQHDALPTHSLTEISLLASRFPNNIKLFVVGHADDPGCILAGAVVYLTLRVAHTQYLFCDSTGREVRALDFLIGKLINRYSDMSFISFGISTENGGETLNFGLLKYKSGFGGEAIGFDAIKIDINPALG